MWIIPALACLAFAVFTMLAAPSLLTRGTWQVRHPQLALGLWHGAVLGGSLALLAAVALSVVAVLNWEHDEGSWLSGFEIALASVFASAGLIAMFGWGFIITRRSGRAFADGRRANDELRDAARVLSYRDERIGGALVRFVESPSPHALAAAGPSPVVIVSSGLEELLTRQQLEAVVAHERCHLVRFHALAQRLAEVNEACLPRYAGAKNLSRATALLIELIADDAAAEQAGADALAGALDALAGAGAGAGAGADGDGDGVLVQRARRLRARAIGDTQPLRGGAGAETDAPALGD
ncbi:M48 family metalloprotease [Pseudoclavibacter helvolus]|uniref:M48 family metalloprotease n=1 Tax=Pseudoclavibacter helvolus TaxID=255205 RepID=UPI003734FBDA